ncbi:MAG: polysaccharide deacetylase [Sulfuricurvum sp. RIFOXYD2_FULL_44_160]|uniref:polysaccharide deacetylase family protein n=1 Tax=unclassified Sulfuricurvum TaxID=2632390 RepID=UPI0008B9A943|nr:MULTISPECIES: polysaccharide deacetylase family protein [unclassified Sulfuricurvum]OHD91651.1 MAG: polysaccharide deacetylase [Sulfuricurvum sp. RIFOXYD2_FULL_44_160]OHD95868.1 MAG: polysaccharide deacetylase [Sulfuricurvum sp. RIFOXYD12_FULL_44_77]
MIKNLLFLLLIAPLSLTADEPAQWGENVSGVVTTFDSSKKEIALTFDACGGSFRSSQYDAQLIDFLSDNHIPATLFINSRWIQSNPEIFARLAANPLFEIANHGTAHRPLSVNGKSVYNIPGTASAEEVAREINGNGDLIEKLTGKRPLFFRSGTAYYDEQAISIAHQNGVEIAGFSILGDAGATFSPSKVAQQLLNSHSGDILLFHMNHPEGGTREGIIEGVTKLKGEGFSFVRLSEVKDRLNRLP